MGKSVAAFALVAVAWVSAGWGGASPRVIFEDSGLTHSCRLLVTGTVECFGANPRGQLGNGMFGVSSVDWLPVIGLRRVRSLVVGGGHNCVVLGDGMVRCWGSNVNGQLGDGTLENRSTPVLVRGLRGVKELAAAASATCALLVARTVRCWGSAGSFGSVFVRGRSAQRRPIRLGSLGDVVQIAAGEYHVCALRRDGQVWCVGSNLTEAIMDQGPDYQPEQVVVPRRLPDLSPAKRIAAGRDEDWNEYTCALLRTGAVRCRGDGAPRPAIAARLFR